MNKEYNKARSEQLEYVIEEYRAELRPFTAKDWKYEVIKSRLDESVLEWEEINGRKFEVKK